MKKSELTVGMEVAVGTRGTMQSAWRSARKMTIVHLSVQKSRWGGAVYEGKDIGLAEPQLTKWSTEPGKMERVPVPENEIEWKPRIEPAQNILMSWSEYETRKAADQKAYNDACDDAAVREAALKVRRDSLATRLAELGLVKKQTIGTDYAYWSGVDFTSEQAKISLDTLEKLLNIIDSNKVRPLSELLGE